MSNDSTDLEYKKRMTVVTVATVLFILLSLPKTYELVANLFSFIPVLDSNGCPSVTGVLLHGFVFFLIFFAMHHFQLLIN